MCESRQNGEPHLVYDSRRVFSKPVRAHGGACLKGRVHELVARRLGRRHRREELLRELSLGPHRLGEVGNLATPFTASHSAEIPTELRASATSMFAMNTEKRASSSAADAQVLPCSSLNASKFEQRAHGPRVVGEKAGRGRADEGEREGDLEVHG